MDILHKNLLILASAGSGKTYQLGNRVIGKVAGGVPPERIVALTFTRKAAGEFADAVLTKLAAAASDPVKARDLARDIGLASGADFAEVLERVVKSLPRFTLGTMDSFFAKIVRDFQYELGLTGGRFELIEGPRADAARDAIVDDILGSALEDEGGEAFFHAFRRANLGREEFQVRRALRDFLGEWHARYRLARHLHWGPDAFAAVEVDDWEKEKDAAVRAAEEAIGSVKFTHGKQCDALRKALEVFRSHTVGSGVLGGCGSKMVEQLLAAACAGDGSLEVKFQKDFVIDGACGRALLRLIRLAALCEMAAAVRRTRAIREVVGAYDALCETRLRRNGLLGFDDVKELMGRWARDENARVGRELVDFRLDARYDHWLLDEFQDTSRADWLGLEPLLDEVAGRSDGTMFIVGDRKQAIYGWRGGDVGLFDEALAKWGRPAAGDDALKVETMADSWRSCPEVLALVNTVCGDTRTMARLFGEDAASRWEWQEHVSAPPLQKPEKCGEARVERCPDGWEERLVPLLEEIGVGRRALTCGVLVRNNDQVREVADHLRAAGFDVVEEGRRRPAEDGPVGVALANLLRWLAEPSDAFARETVEMSPLTEALADFGEGSLSRWDGLQRKAAAEGFAAMVSAIVERCRHAWSDFGRQRAAEILAALRDLDASGAVSPREAADWIERLEVAQSPGLAAVQVMTIHKSKGLGFDVVVLPEVPKDSVPQTQYFELAQGDGWLTGVPPSWARNLLPDIARVEETWRAQQRYEAFCMLYVALTRAKRGLYVLLGKAGKDGEKPTLANWLAASIDAGDEDGVLYRSGSSSWMENVGLIGERPVPKTRISLPAPVPRRERTAPSEGKPGSTEAFRKSIGGMRFGREVHAAFESLGWIDEQPPGPLPESVAGCLDVPEIRGLFERRGREVELFREQPVEAILDGQWLSGTIDRLHVFREHGRPPRLEIVDFKTDAVDDPAILAERHAPQMRAYRRAMEAAWPGARVECLLVSTTCRTVIRI